MESFWNATFKTTRRNFWDVYFQIFFSHKYNYFSAKEPEYFFTQKLPEKYSVTRRKEAVMECFVSDPRAKVKWYRNGEPIDVSEGQIIFKFR